MYKSWFLGSNLHVESVFNLVFTFLSISPSHLGPFCKKNKIITIKKAKNSVSSFFVGARKVPATP